MILLLLAIGLYGDPRYAVLAPKLKNINRESELVGAEVKKNSEFDHLARKCSASLAIGEIGDLGQEPFHVIFGARTRLVREFADDFITPTPDSYRRRCYPELVMNAHGVCRSEDTR